MNYEQFIGPFFDIDIEGHFFHPLVNFFGVQNVEC